MGHFEVTFNNRVRRFIGDPVFFTNASRREALRQCDRIIADAQAKGVSHHGILNWDPNEVSYKFKYSVDLDLGVETVSIFVADITVPVIVIDQKFPWAGGDNHSRMAEFNKYQITANPKGYQEVALRAVIGAVNGLMVKCLKDDIRTIENHDPHLALEANPLETLL